MAVTNFVPDIWSARILSNLSRTAVAAGICNRDYEGDTTMGDSVKITSITDPTIGSYAGTTITTEAITDATQALALDQKKYFSVYLDDVERAQAVDGGRILQEAVDRASYGLANTLDAYVLNLIATGASSSNPDHLIAEATISTVTDAYDAIVNWGALLDEQDVPPENRWTVVTPGFYGKLLKDSRFIAAGDVQYAETRANGLVGRAAGFEVYKSNNLPDGPGAGAGKAMIAGSRYAITMAEQVRSVEALRLQTIFGDAVRGLHVYGAKVTRAKAILSADVIIS